MPTIIERDARGHILKVAFRPMEERFWGNVNKNGPIPQNRLDLGPCWLWTASHNNRGYGYFGRHTLAHRFAYELLVDVIPEGLTLDHLCRTPACVRPDHLEPVTHKENCQRGMAGFINGQRQRAKMVCPAGHPYDLLNTYLDRRGQRNCRACGRVAALSYWRRKHDKN